MTDSQALESTYRWWRGRVRDPPRVEGQERAYQTLPADNGPENSSDKT